VNIASWNLAEKLFEGKNECPFQFVPRFDSLAWRARHHMNCKSLNSVQIKNLIGSAGGALGETVNPIFGSSNICDFGALPVFVSKFLVRAYYVSQF
jgi:hypothetical protein